MKILQINTFYNRGSTGKIVKGIEEACRRKGIECLSAYRYRESAESSDEKTVTVSSWLNCRIHGRFSQYTMLKGCLSIFKTKRFLKKVESYKPDLIHIHNLHGSYINIPMLMKYIKKKKLPVVMTLHDCWPFTGGCSHFESVSCERWKSGCGSCPQLRKITSSPFDLTSPVFNLKKSWFNEIESLTLVTPSEWLAQIVKESFLKVYPVEVINNGIDLNVFKPSEENIREKYNIPKEKFMVLGVAFDWNEKKGLDVFVELSSRLENDFQIVLVGVSREVKNKLPNNIIPIEKTESRKELSELYSAADLFLNPTQEDTYPTVNLEALACGTPVLTFKTGGSPESLDCSCGAIVERNDITLLEKEIRRISSEKPFSKKNCLKRAAAFSETERFEEYIELYKKILTEK